MHTRNDERRLVRIARQARDLLVRIGKGRHWGPTEDLMVARALTGALQAYTTMNNDDIGCLWCGRPAPDEHWPYCSSACAVRATVEDEG